MSMIAKLSGVPMADIVKTLLYRPEFFGRAMTNLTAEMMRGASYWTSGEREYMGMFTAQLHQCPFCIRSHTELVRLASGGAIDPANPDSIRPEVAAVLKIVESATRLNDRTLARDIERIRSMGVSDEAIVGALYVNFVWNAVNRVANTFGFELHQGQELKGAQALHRFGYRFPSFLIGKTRHSGQEEHGTNRYTMLAEDLRQALLGEPARLDRAIRAAVVAGDTIPVPWRSFSSKVREASYSVTQNDIDKLRADGRSEDEVFEMTVCAAVGAAADSLQFGLQAVQGAAKGASA